MKISATRMFRRIASDVFRMTKVKCNIHAQVFSTKAGRNFAYLIGGGGTTSLALSLFGSSPKKSTEFDSTQSIDVLVREADLLYNSYLVDQAYKILRKYRNSDDPELLWRLARVLCEQAKQCQNLDEKKRLFYEALEFAQKALSNEPERGCFGAHKWYAIILDYVGEQEGTKSRLKKSLQVKEHLERALEINPLDATTWHILGVWHFTFADMSPQLYYTAKIIYATPPTSTYDEALRHFDRAETISPGFYSANTYYLALTMERMKKLKIAEEMFKNAFYAPVLTVDDRHIHEKALKHLKKNYGYTEETLCKMPGSP